MCTRFHALRAAHSSFRREIIERDKWHHVCICYQLLLLPTPRHHALPARLNTAPFKTTAAHWEWNSTTGSYQVTPIKALGLDWQLLVVELILFWFLIFWICDNLLSIWILKHGLKKKKNPRLRCLVHYPTWPAATTGNHSTKMKQNTQNSLERFIQFCIYEKSKVKSSFGALGLTVTNWFSSSLHQWSVSAMPNRDNMHFLWSIPHETWE